MLNSFTKSFYDWCIENNRQDILNRWDYNLNQCNPQDIYYSMHSKFYFTCDKDPLHESQLYLINSITNMKIELHCRICGSFGNWCISNNHQDYLELWDYKLNRESPFLIPKCTSIKYYFKCRNHNNHLSELKNLHNIVSGHDGCLNCIQCNSIANYIINEYGEDGLDLLWDYNKNKLNPWEVSKTGHKKIWIKCLNTDYHGSYETEPCYLSTGVGCSYCGNMKLHPNDSIGSIYKNYMDLWSDKNLDSPYNYAPFTTKVVWWKCENGIHDDYKRKVSYSVVTDFRCPECVRERSQSFLQEKVSNYIENTYHFTLKHERACSIVPRNPKVNYKNNTMPFDNEVVELKLIIEVHGQQHYDIVHWHNMAAENNNTTPAKEFHKRKLYDHYKKLVALHNGYFYLEIPYWTEKDESYKTLIDNKIREILQQNNIAS